MLVAAASYSPNRLYFLLPVPPACGLRLSRVSVPAFRKKGESALLECKYELKKFHSFRMQHHDQHHDPEEEAEEEHDEDEEELEEDALDSQEVPERHRQRQQQHHQRTKKSAVTSRRGHRRAEEFPDIKNRKFSETSEALYSVKWYKDNEEFYRYLPKSNPPQHSYRVEGIRVDVSIRFQGIGTNTVFLPTTPPAETHSLDSSSSSSPPTRPSLLIAPIIIGLR